MNLLKEIISLNDSNKLTENKIAELKDIYNSSEVDVVCACVTNDIEYLKLCIEKNYSLNVCNGEVLRHTVSMGYVEVSKLLLKNGIEP